MVKVKVCGLTNLNDALIALEFGVDFLGFIVDVPVETPRKITLPQAAGILQEIERRRAIIVVMPSTLKPVEAVLELKPFGVQFHSNETPKFMQEVRDITFKTNLIKTIHVKENSTFEELKKEADSYSPLVDYFLLDTQTDKVGGSGETHDWDLSTKLVNSLNKPVFLSGGLNLGNVCDAVKRVRPYAVDASSGLESKPGVKDATKIKHFVGEVRQCST